MSTPSAGHAHGSDRSSLMMSTHTDSKPPQKQVFFIGFWPDYDEYSLGSCQAGSIKVKVINLKKSKYSGNVLTRWSKKARLHQLKKVIQKLTKKHPESMFFFQGKANLTRILIDIPINFQAAIICRNIVAKNESLLHGIPRLKAKGVAIWSSDEGDCKTYSLKHYSQFVRKSPLQNNPTPAIDVLFVGRNKGRKPILDKLNASLSAAGFNVYARVTGDETRLISYQEYLSLLADSKCLLDISQDGQVGLTLRPIEAALYGKKIITTNASIKKTALYNPNNVLILTDATTIDEISAFLNAACTPVAAEVVYEYSPENLVNNLLDR